ncbi:hypothetical protein FACS1894105_11280 [Clostridia bacterium]|nr:hypothetical protein FACS1894105_11190 [Clostridia bacterium]GHU38040.1 hypothetical protein FACS1894105_11280 [Clostridia bacterium]
MIKKYKIELHCHSKEVSGCSSVSSADAVRLYKDKGYDALTITDHYYDGFFERKNGSWNDKVEAYLKGYKLAQETGAKLGVTVYLGLELRFKGENEDYLLYGANEEFVLNHPELYNLTQRDIFNLSNECGLFFAQAHPFRSGMINHRSEYLNGIEVYNAHAEHSSNNPKALEWAEKSGLIGISGSDFHAVHHAARGGIFTETLPKNEKELAQILRSNQFELIRTEGFE